MNLVYKNRFVTGTVPVDINGAGANSDYINMGRVNSGVFAIQIGVSAASAVTLTQAKTAAGGSPKALAFTKYYTNIGLADDTLTEATAASNTFNVSATDNLLYIIPVDARDLDTANDYNFVRVNVADPSASCLCGILFVGEAGRYMESTPPTIVA